MEQEGAGCSKDLVEDLRRQLQETKQERDAAQKKNTDLQVAMKEKEIKTDLEVRVLKFRVEKAEGKKFEYGDLEKTVLNKE